jgi:hypothetical protein
MRRAPKIGRANRRPAKTPTGRTPPATSGGEGGAGQAVREVGGDSPSHQRLGSATMVFDPFQ